MNKLDIKKRMKSNLTRLGSLIQNLSMQIKGKTKTIKRLKSERSMENFSGRIKEKTPSLEMAME